MALQGCRGGREILTVQIFKAELICIIFSFLVVLSQDITHLQLKSTLFGITANVKVVTVVDFTDICDPKGSYIFIYHNGVYS